MTQSQLRTEVRILVNNYHLSMNRGWKPDLNDTVDDIISLFTHSQEAAIEGKKKTT